MFLSERVYDPFSVRGFVGSVSTFVYMVSSDRWFSPSLTYCSVSSITMPEPLSALLITRVSSCCSSLRAFLCVGVRFGVVFRGLSVLICSFILYRYFSMSGEAFGGFQELFFLNGCGSTCGLSLKKNLSRLLLSKSLRDSDMGIGGESLLGTKVKPNERTSNCGGLRVFDDRLVIYLLLFSMD